MLRWGPDDGPVVVAALPLLEEGNRVRAFMVAILRALAERGVAGALPDLPGTGESLADGANIGLQERHEAFAAAVGQSGTGRAVHCVAIRSGVLLDEQAALASRWYLAAQDAERLLREWQRVVDAAAREANAVPVQLNAIMPDEVIDIAGHRVPGRLIAALADYRPGAVASAARRRDVRLMDDPGPADLRLPGTPLWRRAEPGNDVALTQALAEDVARWVRACDGC